MTWGDAGFSPLTSQDIVCRLSSVRVGFQTHVC